MYKQKIFTAFFLSILLVGCGSSSGSPASSTPQGYYITIANMAFSPLDLQAPPGATITVINQDSFPHTVTSEAAPGAFAPGGVAGVSFDTGSFTGQTSFGLQQGAPEGTVIPYYCAIHTTAMATPNATITIQSSAQSQSTSGSSSDNTGLPSTGDSTY
jgi:plastocyanin